MKIKLLLGSIGAVIILILVSWTNVVGVQSQSSESVKNSPLFDYRTKKATKVTPDSYRCRYIGMENTFNIPLLAPDQKEQIVLTFIQNIVRMDESTFNKLITYCINRLVKDDKIKNSNIAEMLSDLQKIRKNPEYIFDQITNKSSAIERNDEIRPQQYTIDSDWKPGCLLSIIFYMIFIYPILVIFVYISALQDCFHSVGTNCEDCPCYRLQMNRYLYDLDRI